MKRETFHLLLLVSLLGLFGTPVAALVTYTDNFEDDTVPNQPTADWYEFTFTAPGGGQGRVTSAASLSTVNSVIIQDSSGSETHTRFDLSPFGIDYCESAPTGFWQFAVNFQQFPNVGQIIEFQIRDPDDSTRGPGVTVFDTGNIRAEIDNTAGLIFAPLITNNWYDIRLSLSVDGCESNNAMTVTAYVTDGVTGAEVGLQQVTDPGVPCSDNSPTCVFDEFLIGTPGATQMTLYLDDLVAGNVNDPPPAPIGALATVAVTNLVGFSVDRTATTVIVRHDNGDDVSTYSGNTLAFGATEDTDCTRSDAVLAQRTPSGPLVLYMDCEPGGNPDTFKIRSGALNVPGDLSGCGTGCADIDTDEFASPVDDDQLELAEVVTFPIDFNVRQSGTGINNPSLRTWKTAWAWSGTGSLTGEVGVALYTNCQGTITCDDDARLARQNFGGTSGAAEDVCTGQDGTQPYMAVADTSVPTQIYPITFSNSTRTGTTISDLRATIGTPSVFGGQQGSAIGVACGQGRIGIVTPTTVSVVSRNGGAPLWTTPCSCKTRGIAMSDVRTNGTQYVAWLDGTGYRVAHTNNGTQVASGTFGTISGHTDTAMDSNAQFYYIASNDLVAVYPIHFITGSIGTEGQPGATISGTGPAINFIGAPIPIPEGFTSFGWKLFMGALLIFGIAAVGFFSFDKSIPGLYAGGFTGFLISWGTDLLNTVSITAIIVLIILGIYLSRRFNG